MATKQNGIWVYDFTIPADRVELGTLKDWCKTKCKKWVFQKERGEDGYVHYQVRVSLQKKKRVGKFVKEMVALNWGVHVTPTSEENSTNFNYVMKEETRIEGPWTDQDSKIPSHLQEIPVWRPWQQKVVDSIKKIEPRTINVIRDPRGNNGKSYLSSWLAVRKLARRLPAINDTKDVMRMVMDAPKAKCYFIDLPRAQDKKRLHNLIAAIEEIKNGYAYDDRYQFKEEFFEVPNIWIFTNMWIPSELLSVDRWTLWTIDSDGQLVPDVPGI